MGSTPRTRGTLPRTTRPRVRLVRTHERFIDARARRGGRRDERGRDRASRPRHREAGDGARVGAVEPCREPRGASPSRGALPAVAARLFVRRARAHAARRDRRPGRAGGRAARRRARRGGPGGAAREAGSGRSGDARRAERRILRRRFRFLRLGESVFENPLEFSNPRGPFERPRCFERPKAPRPRPTVPAQSEAVLSPRRVVDGDVFPRPLRVAFVCDCLRHLRHGVRGARRARGRGAPLRAQGERAEKRTVQRLRQGPRREEGEAGALRRGHEPHLIRARRRRRRRRYEAREREPGENREELFLAFVND
mmetsp:Transcript_175/g.675  ORF Transcript_175/g.675 Transcript_175/m.675 type:complete len:311 (+) Transcript_175:3-935(+)